MGILTVHLEKITNLADDDHIGNSDPYVKVCAFCVVLFVVESVINYE